MNKIMSFRAALLLALGLSGSAFGQVYQPPTAFTAPGTLAVQVAQYGTGTIEVQATGTGSGLTFATQCLPTSGVNWVALPMVVPTTGVAATSQSANGDWLISVSGFSSCRVSLTAISGGTETIGISPGAAPNLAATPGDAAAGNATAANQALQLTQETTIATNTTGAATAANQSTGNTSAATTATNTTTIAGNTAAASTDGSTTQTAGGTAQVLFSSTVPTHGFKVAIPVAFASTNSNVCFVSDTTATPSATTPGSYPIYLGGQYSTEKGQKPVGAVYINCPTTGQAISAQRW